MNRIKYILVTIILTILSFGTCFGQNDEIPVYGIIYQHTKGLSGTPFLNKEWSIGNIITTNNDVARNQRLKYDILKNELVYYNEKYKRIFTVDPLTVSAFVLNPGMRDSIFFQKYKGPEIGYRLKPGHFVEMAYKGSVELIIRHTADISEANDITSKDKIIRKDLYFIQQDENIHEIKPTLRSIIKLFPEHKQTIKKTAHDINFQKRSTASLVELLGKLDNLNVF